MAGFQTPAPLSLSGDVHPTIVHEPGLAPQTIIKKGTPFHVHVLFNIWGSAVPLLSGNFKVQIFFEAYGPGQEVGNPIVPLNVPVTSVPMLASGPHGPNERNYDVFVAVPAGLLGADLYEMVAVITYTDVNGNPGPIAGFSDEQVIQVFP